MILCMLATGIILTKEADKKILKEDKVEDDEIKSKIGYFKVLADMRVIMAFLAAVVSYMTVEFLEPILSLRLNDFGYAPEISGYLFTAMTTPYIIGCAMVPLAMKKHSKRTVMIIAFILVSFLSTLFGPSEVLNFPD